MKPFVQIPLRSTTAERITEIGRMIGLLRQEKTFTSWTNQIAALAYAAPLEGLDATSQLTGLVWVLGRRERFEPDRMAEMLDTADSNGAALLEALYAVATHLAGGAGEDLQLGSRDRELVGSHAGN